MEQVRLGILQELSARADKVALRKRLYCSPAVLDELYEKLRAPAEQKWEEEVIQEDKEAEVEVEKKTEEKTKKEQEKKRKKNRRKRESRARKQQSRGSVDTK